MKRLTIWMTLLLILATGCAAPAAQQNTGNTALQAELDAVNEQMAALQAELDALKAGQPQAEPSAQPEVPSGEPAQDKAEPAPGEAPAAQADPTPIPVANTEDPPASYTKSKADYDLDGLAAETAAAVEKADGAEPRNSRDENYALYREIDQVLESMDRKLDQTEDQAEGDYREGLLSRADYVEIERELEALEDDLDRAEDALEYRLGVDD